MYNPFQYITLWLIVQQKKDCPAQAGQSTAGYQRSGRELLLYNFQHFHGAGLDADAAGDALGSGVLGLEDHDLHGAGLHTLAAADAVLLVDHVHAGLGVLGDGVVLAGLHALAALDAHIGLGAGSLGNNLNAAQILIEFLIECLGTRTDTLQACHALNVFFYREFFHDKTNSFMYFKWGILLEILYTKEKKIAMAKLPKFLSFSKK